MCARPRKGGGRPGPRALLERYRNYLFFLARVQLGGGSRARSTSSTWSRRRVSKCIAGFGQFRVVGGEFLAWLRQILERHTGESGPPLLRNQASRRPAGTRSMGRPRPLVPVAGGGAGRDPEFAQRQASRREQAVLPGRRDRRLPDDYREVIILRQLEGLSFPQVAERMGRTEDSVKNLWARALGSTSAFSGGARWNDGLNGAFGESAASARAPTARPRPGRRLPNPALSRREPATDGRLVAALEEYVAACERGPGRIVAVPPAHGAIAGLAECLGGSTASRGPTPGFRARTSGRPASTVTADRT